MSGVCVPTGGCAVYISTAISQSLCSCVAQVTVFQVNYLCLMMVSLNPCFPDNRCSNYTQTATRNCPVLILITVQFMYFLFSKMTPINSSFWSHTLLSTFGYCFFLCVWVFVIRPAVVWRTDRQQLWWHEPWFSCSTERTSYWETDADISHLGQFCIDLLVKMKERWVCVCRRRDDVGCFDSWFSLPHLRYILDCMFTWQRISVVFTTNSSKLI